MARLLAIIAIGIWGILLSPHLTSGFVAAVAAALTLPVYRWLRVRMGKLRAIGCFLTGLSFCVAAPITIAVSMVVPQTMEGARRLSVWWQSGHPIPPVLSMYLHKAYELFIEYVPNAAEYLEKVEHEFDTVVNAVFRTILSSGLNLAGDTMGAVWALVLFLIFTTLFVVYAPAVRRAVLLVLPGHDGMVDRFSLVFRNASRAVFIGLVFVPVIQGTLTGIGLRLLDVPDPAFWGLLAIFVAVIPMAGTALIWVPAAIYLGATRSLTDAFLMLAWGCLIVSSADNLLRPYFLKTGIQASMIVLLLSIICSLAVFGAVGLIAGPVLVALAVQAIQESKLLYQSRSAGYGENTQVSAETPEAETSHGHAQ